MIFIIKHLHFLVNDGPFIEQILFISITKSKYGLCQHLNIGANYKHFEILWKKIYQIRI